MDSVIIFAAIILNPRARKRRRLAAAEANVEPEGSTTPPPGRASNAEMGEVTTGAAGVDITRSTTLHSTIIPIDVDIESKAGLGGGTNTIGGGSEREKSSYAEDLPSVPVSGTTTVVGDPESLDG